MSYILDALQRAEAEREQQQPANPLHSALVQPPAANRPPSRRKQRPWVRWLKRFNAAVLACTVALLGWLWWPSQPEHGAPVLPAPTPAPVAASLPAQAAAPAATAPSPAAATAAPQTPPTAALPLLAPERPSPATAGPAAVPQAEKPATPTASATPTAPTRPKAPATAASSSTAPGPLRSLSELSAETRAEIPTLRISGSTYAEDPAMRMLIINGQVVQEGQDIAPGLRLESIGLRSAVFNHRGLRFSLAY